ncbi:MAG TPA: glycoside hydrolase family 3 N-terminal domain-containing protein [Candidatus Hydrogenedentes bacterium]|nr:glycoside hydrolase family 3 N-terminal domain-containing protein [Candidatus Hydrogenedentota bacterium]HRT21434.1 glycoside hydrolase family 3 N-terminal domain-containing protein [Candidatus Hydrogenedentota bacterium]HRT66322.1 glycoside hydrolase family 3 N-terminal domain-containing protein [Candidatus Hydrogenedentota bacterium]
MNGIFLGRWLAVIVLCSAPAWAQQGGSGLAGTVNPPPGREPAALSAPSPAQPPESPSGPKQEAALLRGKIAQLMLVTLNGLYGPRSEETEFLLRYPPAGLVIPMIVEPRDAAEYIRQLRGLESRTGSPLLIGTQLYDLPQRQHLFKNPFVQLPTLLSLAASSDLDATGKLAKLTADHLNAMGFNLNLGPRLDLAPTLPSAVGGVDHLGSDPRFAAKVAGTIQNTLESNGIIAMPMGFPGGGENRTGQSPATLLTPKIHLMEHDLLPFRKAIEQGTPMLHVGDTLVPTLDESSPPACISRAVIHGLLRGELGYEGVIVAGPVDAPDVQRQRDTASAAIMALDAGADIVYWSETGQKVARAIEAVAAAVEKGLLERERIEEAFERVVRLKTDRKLAERNRPGVYKAASLETSARYPKEAYEVERRSITVLKNAGNVLPLESGRSTPAGVTGVFGVEEMTKLLKRNLKAVVQQNIQTAQQLGDIEDFEIARITGNITGLKTVVCVLGTMKRNQGEARLVRKLKEAGARVVVVWLGHPRPLVDMLEADGIVVAYCDPTMCGASIKAVADVLVGKCPLAVLPALRELRTRTGREEVFNAPDVLRAPAGRLPVSLGGAFVAGYGVSYDPEPFIKKVEWRFGDGQRASEIRAVHAYESPGRYEAILTVTDRLGAVTSGAFPVVVE